MQNKAQFWYSDFLLAILILVGISFLFIGSITNLNAKQDNLQVLASDSIAISNSFMSEGYCPSGCTTSWGNLQGRIGFVKDGKVIQNNLIDLIGLVSDQTGYENSKILVGTKNDYIFFFEDGNQKITINGAIGNDPIYGKWDISDISQINAESLIKTTRIVYLDDGITKKLVRLVIIVW